MDIIKKGFGERLKTYRKVRNYTQEKLAEDIGVNLRQLARIEAGESFVTAETLFRICSVLEVSPKVLFDYDIETEMFTDGTNNQVYFNVIKSGNIVKLIPTSSVADTPQTFAGCNNSDFDTRMQNMAKKLKKEIYVDEIEDGIPFQRKIYKQNGQIETIINDKTNKEYENLKQKILKIAKDKEKLEYISLAYESLHSREALNELKTLIKGIELTLN